MVEVAGLLVLTVAAELAVVASGDTVVAGLLVEEEPPETGTVLVPAAAVELV